MKLGQSTTELIYALNDYPLTTISLDIVNQMSDYYGERDWTSAYRINLTVNFFLTL